jgi:dipeptidyl aminopeptidase/acylaminoacyl peptidase
MTYPRLPQIATPLASIALAICVVSVAAPAQRGTIGLAYEITYSQTYDPSLSPDGKRMVFISAVAGREQLFIGNIDGTGAVQITHDSIDHEDPSWSPDGRSASADEESVVDLFDGSRDARADAAHFRGRQHLPGDVARRPADRLSTHDRRDELRGFRRQRRRI